MSGVGRLRVEHRVRAFGTAGRVSYTVGARETSERVAASVG